jgi:hypothetical protein
MIKDDPDPTDIDSRAMIPVVSFPLVAMLALVRIAFSIARVGKERRGAGDKCNAGQNSD